MALALTFILLLSLSNVSAATRRTHKRLVIHVPYRIKTHHHIHTVYSQIRSGGSSVVGSGASTGTGKDSSSSKGGGGTKQTIYKIVSIAMQGAHGYGGHGGHYVGHTGTGHGGGHGGGGSARAGRKNRNRGGTGSGGGAEALYEYDHAGTHIGSHDGHGPGDNIIYDDYHSVGTGGGGGGAVDDDYHVDGRTGRCERDGARGYGDMVFKHFSRSSDESHESEEYPEVEEYVDEDEWV